MSAAAADAAPWVDHPQPDRLGRCRDRCTRFTARVRSDAVHRHGWCERPARRPWTGREERRP